MLTDRNLIGKIIRLPLRFIPRDRVVRILRGPLRGKKWIAGSMSHGFWLGIYVDDLQRELVQHVEPCRVAYDVGANVGFISLLLSDLVGESGQVIAIEPHPVNVDYIHRHMQLNRVQNVTVLAKAVSHEAGTVSFQSGKTRLGGRVASDGDMQVEAIILDECELPPPDYIKMNIEGLEYDALRGAERLLREYHPMIFLETHGDDIHEQCIAFLTQLGYRCEVTNVHSSGLYRNVLAR